VVDSTDTTGPRPNCLISDSVACRFNFNVYDYPTCFDLKLLEEYGWYTASNRGNNLDGISRDHSYSVREGFRNNIDPKIISHPANCVLMRQNENSKKKTKCNITIGEFVSLTERTKVAVCKTEVDKIPTLVRIQHDTPNLCPRTLIGSAVSLKS
jgi:hypothetical protein